MLRWTGQSKSKLNAKKGKQLLQSKIPQSQATNSSGGQLSLRGEAWDPPLPVTANQSVCLIDQDKSTDSYIGQWLFVLEACRVTGQLRITLLRPRPCQVQGTHSNYRMFTFAV